MAHHTDADLFILMQADAYFIPECAGHLPRIVELCMRSPVTWIGWNGQNKYSPWHPEHSHKRMRHDAPPKSGTQCWSVRKSDWLQVAEHMCQSRERITDAWLPSFPGMRFLSRTLAGQHGQRESGITAGQKLDSYLPEEPEWEKLRVFSLDEWERYR